MINKLIIIILLCINIHAANASGDLIKSTINRAIDGDTIEIKLVELPPHLQKVKVRIYGIDTPESNYLAQCAKEKEMGLEAKEYTKKALNSAKHIEYNLIKADKYGSRYDGLVLIDGKSLGDMLIEAGLARRYYGDKKTSWCND